MAKRFTLKGYLTNMVGLEPDKVSKLLDENAQFTAGEVIQTLDRFIKAIAENKSSAGSLKGYKAALYKPKSLGGDNFQNYTLPKSGVKLSVLKRFIRVESSPHHKKFKAPTERGHLNVFDILDSGRKGLPAKSSGAGYALYNLAPNKGIGRTIAGGPSKKKGKGQFGRLRPVSYKLDDNGNPVLRYMPVNTGTILTGESTSVINRPEPRKLRFKEGIKQQDARSKEIFKSLYKSRDEEFKNLIRERRAEIKKLRIKGELRILIDIKTKKLTPEQVRARREALKEAIKNKKEEFTKTRIIPMMLEYGRKIRTRAKAVERVRKNRAKGVKYVRGPILPVPPRMLYKRAVEQTKDRLSGKGFFLFEVVFVKSFGQASKYSRDR